MTSTTSRRRLAFVTGATGGIGRATAIALAQTGVYDIALHYNSAGSTLRDQISETIKQSSPSDVRLQFFQADLGSFDSVREMHAAVVNSMGHPDILFNNAGTSAGITRPDSLNEVPLEAFETAWRVNAGSGILLTQLCVPHMEAQGWGRIIFNSSVAGITGGTFGPHYASSKAAIHGFVHWLAKSVAKKGVTVNAVAPALVVDTVMISEEGASVEELDAKYGARVPVGRGGRSEEIAQTVMWMINCSYVTNKIITVDGGMVPR